VRGNATGWALIFAVLLAGGGHLLIKHGLAGIAPGQAPLAERLLQYFLAPFVVLGLAVYGAGTLLWILVVSKREISYLYPITALNYVLIGVGGMLLFDEPVSLMRWAGILVVVLGVALMQTSAEDRHS
jgi:drug/metabolite transporter (DMT)-like permease